PVIRFMPAPFHPSLGRQRVCQSRNVLRPFHLIHHPVVTAARLQSDLRLRRQLPQKLPERLPVVVHPNGRFIFPFLVHRRKHREFLMRITSDKLCHIPLQLLSSWVLPPVYGRTRCSAFIGSLKASQITRDPPRVVRRLLQPNLQGPRRYQPRKAFAPFDQHHRILLEDLFQPQRFHFSLF